MEKFYVLKTMDGAFYIHPLSGVCHDELTPDLLVTNTEQFTGLISFQEVKLVEVLEEAKNE